MKCQLAKEFRIPRNPRHKGRLYFLIIFLTQASILCIQESLGSWKGIWRISCWRINKYEIQTLLSWEQNLSTVVAEARPWPEFCTFVMTQSKAAGGGQDSHLPKASKLLQDSGRWKESWENRPLKPRGRAYLRRSLQQNRETSMPRTRFAPNNKQQQSTAGVASEAETLSSVTPHVRPAQNW